MLTDDDHHIVFHVGHDEHEHEPQQTQAHPEVPPIATGNLVTQEGHSRPLSTIFSPPTQREHETLREMEIAQAKAEDAEIETEGEEKEGHVHEPGVQLSQLQKKPTVTSFPKENDYETKNTTDVKSTGSDDPEAPIHLMSLERVREKLDSDFDIEDPRQTRGLTKAEAQIRLDRDGPNVPTPPKQTPEIIKYLRLYLDPFMLLLNLAAILSAIAYGATTPQDIMNLWIAVVLWVVIFISCTFTYVQEGKASAVMASFAKMLPKAAHVIRDGVMMDVPAATLVVGDVVKIGGGDQCPADLRLFAVMDMKMETSSLTGESLPISANIRSDEQRLQDAKNCAFNSSNILEGEAYGVVYATGDRTLIGTIAGDVTKIKETETPLQYEIRIFVRRLTIFAFIMGVVFFIIGVARKQPILSAFVNGFIVVMIANVPEGLPMTVVSCLTITARRLASLNVFVKELKSVETLGSATVIASDKTGTLTQNKMSVSRFWFDQVPMNVDAVVREIPMQTIRRQGPRQVAHTLLELELVAACCNRARFADARPLSDEEAAELEVAETLTNIDNTMTLRSAQARYPTYLAKLHVDPNMTLRTAVRNYEAGHQKPSDSNRTVLGDASDTALFNFVRMRQNIDLVRFHNVIVFEQPFNSRYKYAIVITKPYNIPGNDRRRKLMMKGAPEVILSRCSHWMCRGEPLPIDDAFRENFQNAYETFGGYGERVLGFAHTILDEKQYPPSMDTQYSVEAQNFPTSGLVFLGLISLVDPPKETVYGAVAQCRTAGVRVVMVTGDHPLTAAAIARQVGIITVKTVDQIAKLKGIPEKDVPEDEVDAIVQTGQQIAEYQEADWNRVLSKREIVFARTTPQQKVDIVRNLKRLGHVVAATGDGVNDSIALKEADIGVAMGISGSDVARDAANVVLMDDDFSSIVVGIREGRTIFDNITKTVAYTLTHMFPEVFPVLCNLAFGLPVALPSILILCIDLGTELAPSISLAYEPSEADVMSRPPRNSKTDRLVTGRVMSYAILQAGMLEMILCFLSFFLVMDYYHIPISNLWFADNYFKKDPAPYYPHGCVSPFPLPDDNTCLPSSKFGNSTDNPYNCLCYDGKYSVPTQQQILSQAQTAYFAFLTFTQAIHIWCCKTRILSLFTHGMTNNITLMFGVVIEACLIIIIIFPNWANDFFQSQIFPRQFWWILVASGGTLFIWSEFRKWMGRRNPKGFFNRWINW